jgi:energy-coupling factor transporter ATP-binding protein EcfA2
MIEARELTKRYGDTTAVHSLSFRIAPGTVTGFLGPNGAGKSTTERPIDLAGAAFQNGNAGHETARILQQRGRAPGHPADPVRLRSMSRNPSSSTCRTTPAHWPVTSAPSRSTTSPWRSRTASLTSPQPPSRWLWTATVHPGHRRRRRNPGPQPPCPAGRHARRLARPETDRPGIGP